MKKPLLEALWHLHQANTTLVFLGDSIMRQKMAAMECELLREFPSSTMTVKSAAVGYTSCHQKITISIPKTAFMFLQPYNITTATTLTPTQPTAPTPTQRTGGSASSGALNSHLATSPRSRQLLGKHSGGNKKGRGPPPMVYEDRTHVYIEVHGLVLGKRGESCIRGGGPISEKAIARGENVLKVGGG